MTYPVYLTPEADASPDGLYLAMFHGRNSLAAELEDWGFEGPMIGPLRYVHTIYGGEIKLCLADDEDSSIAILIIDGLLQFDDKFYGDWTVFMHTQKERSNADRTL